MSNPIKAIIGSADLQPLYEARYIKEFMDEVDAIDFDIYDNYAKKITLPAQYGDSAVNGDTGGAAMRAAGVYETTLDSYKIPGWDDQGFWMNNGYTVDGFNDADYNTDGSMDVGFGDFEVVEKNEYNSSVLKDYNYYDKSLTNRYDINIPIVTFAVSTQYTGIGALLIASEDNKQLVKQFGKMAKVVQTQYIRSTLINGATPTPAITLTSGGTTAELTALATQLYDINTEIEKYGGVMQTGPVKASDGVGTLPARAGYICIINGELEKSISKLPNFLHVTQYGSSTGLLPDEFGTVTDMGIRFVKNNALVRTSGRLDAGIGLKDVMNTVTKKLTTFNMLVFAKDSFAVATLGGSQRYQLYMDAPGKGGDVIREEKRMAWKARLGAAVIRRAHIMNIPITLAV